MDFALDFLLTIVAQLQSPTLAFLIAGLFAAALGLRVDVPDAVYRFVVFMLLMKIGLQGGMEIRDADLGAILLPALFATLTGCAIILIGRVTLCALPGVRVDDGLATAGLFGAVSASTLAAGMVVLEEDGMGFEAWVPALYPFMDIPALVLAIVLANLHKKAPAPESVGAAAVTDASTGATGEQRPRAMPAIWPVVVDSLRGPALAAMLIGIALGVLARPERVYDSFFDPLFRGFLAVLMLIMGMEAWQRLADLRRVAHWYAVYAVVAPFVHGLLAFGLGWVAHMTTGFSPGGVVLLAVIAASSSDISGPPTLRGGIPTANPSAYIGASTAIGTPVAIGLAIPAFLALGHVVFGDPTPVAP